MNIAGEDVAVEHMMPGRIRLRFRSRRGETDFFQRLVTLLSEISLVDEVDANSLTGSVLIRHSASPDQLAFLAAQSGLLSVQDLSTALGDPPAPRREARSGLSAPMAVGLFALALLQLARGRVLGSASEQFWLPKAVADGVLTLFQDLGLEAGSQFLWHGSCSSVGRLSTHDGNTLPRGCQRCG